MAQGEPQAHVQSNSEALAEQTAATKEVLSQVQDLEQVVAGLEARRCNDASLFWSNACIACC